MWCLTASADNKTVADPAKPEAAVAPGKKAPAAEKKKAKAPRVDKSQIVLDIKPWEADTNLDELAKLVRNIEIDGLQWGEGVKKVPIGYGISKLQVSCVVIDEKVVLDDITDKITELEDFVQSVDVFAFNKL